MSNKMKNIFIIPTNQPSRLSVEYGDILITDSPTYGENNQHLYITNDERIKEYYHLNLTHDMVLKSVFRPSSDKNCKNIILTTDPNLIKEGVQSIDDEFLEWFEKNSSCEFVEVNKVCVTGCPNLVLNGVNSLCCGDKKYEIVYPEDDFKKQQRTYLKEIMEADEKSGLYELSKQSKKQTIMSTQRNRIIDSWLEEHGDPKICEQVKRKLEDITKEKITKDTAEKYSEIHQDVSGTLGRYLVSTIFQDGANWQAEKMYSKDEVLNILQTLFDKPEDAITYFEQFKK
jgi:hypothetical protein